MMQQKNEKIDFVIVRLGDNKNQKEASQIITKNLKTNKKINSLEELDLWSLIKINLPQTDPNYKIDSQRHLPELIKYLYRSSFDPSLTARPEIDQSRVDLGQAQDWLAAKKPKVILTLDPIARELLLILRRKAQIKVAIVGLPIKFYLDRLWASEEGDLWSVSFPENKEQLIADFVDEKRVIVAGLPLGKGEFKTIDRLIAQKKLKWPTRGLTIAIVADRLIGGQVEEFIQRISAFPGLQLNIIVLTSDKNFREKLNEKSQSFLSYVAAVSLDENSLIYSALDLLIFLEDSFYLSKVLAQALPSIVISHRSSFLSRDGELDLLSSKGLIIKAGSLRDVVWQTEMILKNQKILKEWKSRLNKDVPRPGLNELVEAIFSRMAKK